MMNKSIAPAARFADRVVSSEVGAGQVYVLPAPVPDVVSFRGSFVLLPDFAAGEELVRDLCISMLDKGTVARTKAELMQTMEATGAQIDFSTDGVRAQFSGQTLSEHLPLVIRMVGEMLDQPSFPDDEFERLKSRFEASIKRSRTDTAAMASSMLSRRLFGPEHPDYSPDPAQELEWLGKATVDVVRGFFERTRTQRHIRMCVVGDTEAGEVTDVLTDSFPDDGASHDPEVPAWPSIGSEPGRDALFIQDRENIDVRMGHALDIVSTDDAYLPLYIANYILGGNFSARLMSVIRDELGLTYGIRSSILGIDCLHGGLWGTSVTLARQTLERGIAETLRQIDRFVEDGVTDDELEEKKSTITGSYQVGQSSTRGLAASILRNAEKGRPVEYLDRFPDRIRETDLSAVNEAIRTYFEPHRIHVSLAGSFEAVD